MYIWWHAVQLENTAAWRCSMPSVSRTRWSWWSRPCTGACRPAAVPCVSTDLSAVGRAWWPSLTADVLDGGRVGSRCRTATCTPSAGVPSKRRHTSRPHTPAYPVSDKFLRRIRCTGWAKKAGHRHMTIILSNLDLFKKITGTFLGKCVVKRILKIQPYFAYVAALSCETLTSVKQNKPLTINYKVV